jgi:hypothetical protein
MKTGQKYIQVFIESEKDLPKEKGYYMSRDKNSPNNDIEWQRFNPKMPFDELKDYWIQNIDWYLQPLPDEPEINDEEPELRETLMQFMIWKNIFINNMEDEVLPTVEYILDEYFKYLKSRKD